MTTETKDALVAGYGAGRAIYIHDGHTMPATLASKNLKSIVGDRVRYILENGEAIVTETVPRKNCLQKSFGAADKEIAANLDRLFIVTAPDQLFNTIAIDRVLAVCHAEDIPVTLLLNKIDLGEEPRCEAYRAAGFEILPMSAKFGKGLEGIRALFSDPAYEIVALCGVSGVGKSTLLNTVVTSAQQVIGELSEKTGQGKQTTSQAFGFPYQENRASPLMVIDLPGSSQFGISHLSKEIIRSAYPEFYEAARQCSFNDCTHTVEPNCGVHAAVEDGSVADFRFESYVDMFRELDGLSDARKYGKKDAPRPQSKVQEKETRKRKIFGDE